MSDLELVNFPFQPVWVGTGLHQYRHCNGTYRCFDSASLPPLREDFKDDFQWLRCQPSPLEFDERYRTGWTTQYGEVDSKSSPLENWKKRLPIMKSHLLADATREDVQIPNAFFSFMDDIELVTRVRSSTDCYFQYPFFLTPFPTTHGGHFLQFYSDSQHCCMWYLYINRGHHCVVVSSEDLGGVSPEFWDDYANDIKLCASSFESFIYRIWIENEIWLRLDQKAPPMNSAMCEYVQFYKAEG